MYMSRQYLSVVANSSALEACLAVDFAHPTVEASDHAVGLRVTGQAQPVLNGH